MAAKKRKKAKARKSSKRRKPAGMAHKGSKCQSFSLVYSKVLHKKVKRCTKFS